MLEQREGARVALFAACLMPDHLHLLIAPRSRDILAFIRDWKSWTSKLARDAGHFGPLWQPGMWDRAMRGRADFEQAVLYIVRNPAATGLVQDPDDWPHTWVSPL